jgi:hypothetical protein
LPGAKYNDFYMTIIEIRPFRNGWQVFESAGVEPVFLNQERAIDYTTRRACFRGLAIADFPVVPVWLTNCPKHAGAVCDPWDTERSENQDRYR